MNSKFANFIMHGKLKNLAFSLRTSKGVSSPWPRELTHSIEKFYPNNPQGGHLEKLSKKHAI